MLKNSICSASQVYIFSQEIMELFKMNIFENIPFFGTHTYYNIHTLFVPYKNLRQRTALVKEHPPQKMPPHT